MNKIKRRKAMKKENGKRAQLVADYAEAGAFATGAKIILTCLGMIIFIAFCAWAFGG